MNPILSLLISVAISQIKPEMVLGLLKELVDFLDPIMSKQGFFVAQIWKVARLQLTGPAAAEQVRRLVADVEARLAAMPK